MCFPPSRSSTHKEQPLKSLENHICAITCRLIYPCMCNLWPYWENFHMLIQAFMPFSWITSHPDSQCFPPTYDYICPEKISSLLFIFDYLPGIMQSIIIVRHIKCHQVSKRASMLHLNTVQTFRNPFFTLAEPLNVLQKLQILGVEPLVCWYFTPVLEQIPSVLWEV